MCNNKHVFNEGRSQVHELRARLIHCIPVKLVRGPSWGQNMVDGVSVG